MKRSVSSQDETLTHEKRVENTTQRGVFLKNFKEFHLVMKHCVECLILVLKQNDFRERNIISDAKMSSFHLISKYSLHINFLCICFMDNY